MSFLILWHKNQTLILLLAIESVIYPQRIFYAFVYVPSLPTSRWIPSIVIKIALIFR